LRRRGCKINGFGWLAEAKLAALMVRKAKAVGLRPVARSAFAMVENGNGEPNPNFAAR
jgi:hypothetical protein